VILAVAAGQAGASVSVRLVVSIFFVTVALGGDGVVVDMLGGAGGVGGGVGGGCGCFLTTSCCTGSDLLG